MDPHIVLPNGMGVDFSNLFGPYRLRKHEMEKAFKANFCKQAIEAIRIIDEQGIAKAHMSKHNEPEPVYFPRMGYVQDGYPNTPETVAKLKEYSRYIKDFDIVIFLGIGGSFLGNRVILDAIGGEEWNRDKSLRKGYPRIYFADNNVDAKSTSDLVISCKGWADKREKDGKGIKIMLVPISKSGVDCQVKLTPFFIEN